MTKQRGFHTGSAPSLPDGGTEGLRLSLPCASLTLGTCPYKALITHQLCRLVGLVSQAVSSQRRGHAQSARRALGPAPCPSGSWAQQVPATNGLPPTEAVPSIMVYDPFGGRGPYLRMTT